LSEFDGEIYVVFLKRFVSDNRIDLRVRLGKVYEEFDLCD